MVLCQLELPIETVAGTLELCAAANVPVMLDPAPAATLPESVWPRVTWFTPNETEAALYVDKDLTIEETAKHLLAKGVTGVVLKRGSEGAYVYCRRRQRRMGACIRGESHRHGRCRRLFQRRFRGRASGGTEPLAGSAFRVSGGGHFCHATRRASIDAIAIGGG